jgi:hypothetical protein
MVREKSFGKFAANFESAEASVSTTPFPISSIFFLLIAYNSIDKRPFY